MLTIALRHPQCKGQGYDFLNTQNELKDFSVKLIGISNWNSTAQAKKHSNLTSGNRFQIKHGRECRLAKILCSHAKMARKPTNISNIEVQK